MKNLLPLLAILFFTHITIAQTDDSVLARKADSLLAGAIGKGIFSGLVVMTHNGKEIYYKQYGYADWNTGRPIERNTLFNIGSLNKLFTAEMIHQLVKGHKLSYDDKLNQYVDLYKTEPGNGITIQQLLDMKAGLGDYLQLPEFRNIHFEDFSLNDLIGIIKKEPLLFKPGTKQQYSNSGYAVLGAVIEKITGKSYEENLNERIVAPLGLKHLFYTKAEKAEKAHRAYGTSIDFEGNKKSVDDIANSSPAGGAYTDCTDLLTFAEAKLKGTLPSGKQEGIGMFAGGTQVWNSVIYVNRQKGNSFVVMANMGRIADELAERLSSIIEEKPYPPIELPFEMTLYSLIKEKGAEYVKANCKDLAVQARLPYDDRFLNFLGYQFLQGGKKEIAIELFKINVELFPDVTNTYDSLGEAYLDSGDKANALKNYKMVLQRDPANEHARKMVKDLE